MAKRKRKKIPIENTFKLKAIETIYNGYKFRSRLEARWAVFFDALNINYEYEAEGFEVNGVWYLPDFRIVHTHNDIRFIFWIEVKPYLPSSPKEIKKITSFAIATQENMLDLESMAFSQYYLIVGDVSRKAYWLSWTLDGKCSPQMPLYNLFRCPEERIKSAFTLARQARFEQEKGE